ncbi:LacI family DNA-binding transcriptional regulator [Rhizobium halophytocola]|uniref:LacI family transcriptional regulator n=1 Tax=Rhizobium halophytocola TaxID=735519 RepID=A0ABS4DUE6_9HYPH|nr:LacI family transcriptional regulator [Rhizobium halophytocola]
MSSDKIDTGRTNRLPLMDDIAVRAGVSLATVDRVLNQRKGVRERTVSLVLRSALEVGYLSQEEYDLLVRPRPPNVVFLLPNGTNPYLRLLGEKVRKRADMRSRDSANIRCFFVDSFAPSALAAALRHHARWADAIACMALDHPAVREATAEIVARNKKVVAIVSDFAPAVRSAYVGLDNQQAGRTAAYLLGRFCRHQKGDVAVIAGSRIYRAHTDREMGFQSLVEEMYPELSIIGVREGHDDRDENYRHTLALIDHHPELVGIYNVGGSSDGIARALKERGRSEDLVFIGHGLSADTRRLLLDGTMDAVINSDPDLVLSAALAACGELSGDGSPPLAPLLKMEILLRENLPL